MRKLTTLITISLLSASVTQAQTELFTEAVITPHFFVALLAGILLALGFQALLTILSVAAGVTAIGDIKERYVESKYSTENKDDDNWENEKYGDYEPEGRTPIAVTVSNGFGIWSLITTSLALFGATALALNLTLIASEIHAIVLSLVIWAAFFLLLFYLEGKLLSTLAGSLLRTATATLRSAGEAVKNLFTPSPQSQAESVVETAIKRARQEFGNQFDMSAISDTLDKHLKEIRKETPDYNRLKKDMKEIMNEASSDNSGSSPAKWMAIQRMATKALEENSGPGNKDKSQQVKDLMNELKREYDRGYTSSEGAKNVAARVAPVDDATAHRYINKILAWLQNASPDSFNKENLRREFQRIKDDPKQAPAVVSEKVRELDKETVVSTLEKNTNLDRSQIEQYADQVENTWQWIRDQVTEATGGGATDQSILDRVERSIAGFLNSTGRPEINYSILKYDLQRAWNNPDEALPVLRRRLETFDVNTLRSVLTNNQYLDEADIDRVVNTVSESRDQALKKMQEVQDAVRRNIENAKRRAVIEAEHARKTAATAAWWLLISAIISAGAAIGGGLLAV